VSQKKVYTPCLGTDNRAMAVLATMPSLTGVCVLTSKEAGQVKYTVTMFQWHN